MATKKKIAPAQSSILLGPSRIKLYSADVVRKKIREALDSLKTTKAAPKKGAKAKASGCDCSDLEACIQCGERIYEIISKLF